MAIIAAFIFPIIPGLLPPVLVALEISDRPEKCNDPDDKIKIEGYQTLLEKRGGGVALCLYATAVQAIISIACESMKRLSTIFWGGAIYSLISVVVNVYLTLSANHEIIRLQAIVDKTIAPPATAIHDLP